MNLKFCGEPLYDKKIEGISRMCVVSIGDYLDNVSLKNNPFQRKRLSISKYYNKLVLDLLDDTVIPPISVVSASEFSDVDVDDDKYMVLDGLQRTNCLFYCLDLLKSGEELKTKITTIDKFREKKIYLEVWTDLTLNSMLYKMVVLNTGQKKMDYSHQLEILSISLYKKLLEVGVHVNKSKDKLENEFAISTVVNGLVSYINGIPISSKKDAATFLFENINSSYESESEEDELGIIADSETYNTLVWVLKDLNRLIEDKYTEDNPLIKYDVFLISLLASIGNVKRKYPERFEIKKKLLEEKLKTESDPLNLKKFNVYYNKFKSGIGDKRRKFIYEAFRSYFNLEHVEQIEWDEVYESIFGK